MNVYTKIDGKLAQFAYDALYNDQYLEAINAVRKSLGKHHKSAILAVITKEPVQYELQFA
jgi:hypothetical protein